MLAADIRRLRAGVLLPQHADVLFFRKPRLPHPSAYCCGGLYSKLEEHRRLDRGGRPRRSYAETLERFRAEYMPMLKPSTQARYETSFHQIAPTFGMRHLDELTRGRFADYAASRLEWPGRPRRGKQGDRAGLAQR